MIPELIACTLVNGKCPKCGAASGDDWSQCGGECPLPGTPHYKAPKPIHGAPVDPYAALGALPLPPIPCACDFKPGDVVTYTNDYGVKFGPHKVLGFTGPDHMLFKWGKFIYIDTDCYWSPVSPGSLKPYDPTEANVHP